MDKYFRTESGEKVGVIQHCAKVLKEFPGAQILIGTDSQNSKTHSKYSTAIVFRYGTRGAHYIYNTTKVPKIRDLFTRLFKECELSIEIAQFITDNSSFKVAGIELDFNDFKATKSTPLVSACRGWVESLGFKAILKSGDMIAVKAADHLARL